MRSYSIALALLFVVAFGVSTAPSQQPQRPYRGSIPWAILLCRFKDAATAPAHDPAYYKSLFTDTSARGLPSWLQDISYGAANMDGTEVHGWYTMTVTETQDWAYSHPTNSSTARTQRMNDCLNAAKNDKTDPFTPSSKQRAYIIVSPSRDNDGHRSDLFGDEDGNAYGNDGVALAEIAHEFGHGVNMEHSFSSDPNYYNGYGTPIGDYDNQWDLMSAANIYSPISTEGTPFGDGPPGLNAFHLDEMGWIPISRVFTLGADGILARSITLASLSHLEASGYLDLRVPIDSDPSHYYTVEYRTADHWDSGIPKSTVLINEIKHYDGEAIYRSYLLRKTGNVISCPTSSQASDPPITPPCSDGRGDPLQTVDIGGVNISVSGISGNQATVTVSTSLAIPCTSGYVWRDTSSIDRVCVTSATKAKMAADVTPAGVRNLPGSDTCKQGFVWRAATPDDHVCVTPARMAEVFADNSQSYNFADQTKVTYGPNTCTTNYKWRQIDEQDYQCVSQSSFDQASADNAAAASRRSGSACKTGFTERQAFPGDHVCVTPAVKSQVLNDNATAYTHLANTTL